MANRTADYRINKTTFRVIHGDLTQVKADVMVSSDDTELSMSGGVSGALLRAGGMEIRQDARKHTPLKIRDVVVTTAGRLPAKYIFHVVTLDFNYRTTSTEADIQSAIGKCLQLADGLGVRHIAFPALATGVADLPFHLVAEVMIRTIADYLGGNTALELVTLTLLAREGVTEDELNLFYERAVALASISSQGNQLNSLLLQLEGMVQDMQQPELLRLVGVIKSELSQAQTVLAENPASLEQLDQLAERSGIAAISRRVVEISTSTQALTAAENQILEAELLNTRLSGLLTQLNIQYSNLNKLQIKKAKYGLDVPLHIENEIEELETEIVTMESQVDKIRAQLDG